MDPSHKRQPQFTSLPVDRQPVLRVFAMPADTNPSGAIFGGWIMSQVDVAGAVPAVRRAKGPVATVAVNSFQFHEPVLVGDLVSLYGEVIRVGRTSVTVDVEVYAERNPEEPQCVKVTEAQLTYVAVDKGGHPREIPTADINPRSETM